MARFQVLEKLADGSTAEVFLAQLPESRERVVVEVLRPELAQDRVVVDRFMAEAVLRRTLVHPNVARRVGAGRTENGRPYLLSEPVTGESLRRLLTAGGPLAPADAVRLLLPLCDAVGYLHARGLTHGNLCPENVFLPGGLRACEPKLLDSGLMLLRTGKPPSPAVAGRTLVRSEYLAPERVKGTRASAVSDIYGLGVLMYELLTGKPPFHGADVQATRTLHLTAPVPELPDALAAFAPLLQRCLAKDPAERYGNARELRDALDALPPQDSQVAAPAPEGPGPGAQLGAYMLVKPLGRGAMGQVFEARHARLGRRVAVKVLAAEYAQRKGFVERFFQEARAAHQVAHPHIVEVHDFVEEPDAPGGPRYALVMELLEGLPLGQLLKQGPVSVLRAVRITRQVAEALDAAHRAGVIHRDIKPDNIFLTHREGHGDWVKVVDFGIAKLAASDPGAALTMTGQVLGTPAYMAPEQLSTRPVDGRLDVYALGTVLYQMLAGRLPFRSSDLGEQLKWLLSVPPPPLPLRSASGEPLPAGLRQLVLACLAKDPAQRPASMGALAAQLAPYAAGDVPPERAAEEPLEVTRVLSRQGPEEDAPLALMRAYEPVSSDPAAPDARGRREESLELAVPPRSRTLELQVHRSGPHAVPSSPVSPRTVAPLPVSPRTVVPPAVPRTGGGRGLVAVAAGLVLVAAGMGVWRVRRGTQAGAASPQAAFIQLQVQSTPTGASVVRQDTGESLGVTPLTLALPREERQLVLRLEREGSLPVEREVSLAEDRWLFVDLVPASRPEAPAQRRR